MAEKEEVRVHAHKRNTHSNRGHPGQNRLYSHLGVKDLREILDRKRSERGQNANQEVIPPPDPSYNYLKDPLREGEQNISPEQPNRPNNARRYYHSKNNANNNYRRDRESYNQNHPKNRDIENPLNIKVEFSTSTGEHVYKIDETTTLPTIKHVPDRFPPQNRSFRGRGRGRGRGQQRTYQTRTIRNNNSDNRTPKNSLSEDKQGVVENPPLAAVDYDENWDDELNQNKNEAAVETEECEQEENEETVVDADEETPLEQGDVAENLQTEIQNLKLEESKPQNNTEELKCDEKVEENK